MLLCNGSYNSLPNGVAAVKGKPRESWPSKGLPMLAASIMLLALSYLLTPEAFPKIVSTIGFYLVEVLWILPG
ncbi:hypothetical protein DRO53_00645, partial [Candidatus Bathyarchaeota archaeon]